jgi:hypothetical protein
MKRNAINFLCGKDFEHTRLMQLLYFMLEAVLRATLGALITEHCDQQISCTKPDVEADLRTMGVKRWRLIAKDRME